MFSGRSSLFAVQSVSLAWNPSVDPNVTGYNVYYGVASRTYTNKIDVGSATNVTVTGLLEGVTYYFAATAYNILGVESDYSSEVSYSVSAAAVVVNQPPTLNAISNVTISVNSGLQTINLTGITSGAPNENQTLTVTAASSNTGLIPNPAVNYSSPNTTGSLTFTPVSGARGLATITVVVNDGGASNNVVNRAFTVNVNAGPTITAIPNQRIGVNLNTGQIGFVVGDAETAAGSLTLSATSSATALLPVSNIVFGGSGSNRTVTLTPIAGQTGVAVVSIGVSDGAATSSTSFQLSVGKPIPVSGTTVEIIDTNTN